ncbi:PrsW family intramembrane metalloprotease [Planctomicrobium sp.]|nr:PrsW family glutamic-type intramembrane protease [Planctomicrobium sp.]MDA7503392.1 PrsW family intramembrane metalloprotease [bacterium]MDB4439342.1 PrsW family intramembrane metalloprotease [Planctomicrobium sp.]MDB4733126.1 PrsW family intramembrane metalloprotease [Planctomicrobium sp.]MDB4743194.1 PrsW family intramembrane metalloprotease [Planctomicrobium sp.]
MSKSSRDQSINSEPHLQSGGWKKDPSERDAEVKVDRETVQENVDDRVHHSVWNEPGVSPVLSGSPPEDALTFANWLEERRSQTGFLDSWALVFCWAFVAGPLAILGTLLGALTNFTFLIPLQIVLIGPIAEELMKIAIPLWVVERRPYLFRSRFQIFICALAGGVAFAAVENVMYLGAATLDWTNPLTRWRWTICVALHTFCCLISALGLARIWKKTMDGKTAPIIQHGVPYFTTAIVVHGTYNAFAMAFEWFYQPF